MFLDNLKKRKGISTMKKFRKIVAIGLTVAMSVGLLSGCGSSGVSHQTKEQAVHQEEQSTKLLLVLTITGTIFHHLEQ